MNDLSSFAVFDVVTGANAGFDLKLVTPQGNESGVTFRLLGEDSDAYQALDTAQRARRIERLRAKNGATLTDEEVTAELVDKLVAVTRGWTGPAGFAPFSAEAARELYSDRKFISINDQVLNAITDRRNFTKG